MKPLSIASHNGLSILSQFRSVTRVVAHRFTGVLPNKVKTIKTDWYKKAESEFLVERKQKPIGYVKGFNGDDLAMLTPQMRTMMSLRMANSQEVMHHRIRVLSSKFRLHPTDTTSFGVTLSKMTEKILNLRRHLIEHPRDMHRRVTMMMYLGRRTRLMKAFFQKDFYSYQRVCRELKIRCVRFAVPASVHHDRQFNNVAVDADKCRFLIRQKLWKGRHRPKVVKADSGNLVRYTRHPISEPPQHHGEARPIKAQVSAHWPYGVRDAMVKGHFSFADPTIPGTGFTKVPIVF